jgi:hypothetical protein
MSTNIILVNRALRQLGEYAITSFDEQTEVAETCSIILPGTVSFLLTAHPWRFAMAKAQLARESTAPISGWRYSFALPAELLMLRTVFSSSGEGASPLLEYEMQSGRLLANHDALWIDYVQNKDPGTWPAWFFRLATDALSADLAVAVGAGVTMAELFHKRAFGTPQEGMSGGGMRFARTQDSQQQPARPMSSFPLAEARGGNGAFDRW